jgi:hypothetical protein
VLRDYPLRLWQHQQQHWQDVMREFQLMLAGQEAGMTASPPQQLLDLVDGFTQRFGPLISAVNEERQAALDEGRDRVDSRVPLIEGAPALMAQVDTVLRAVDEYCSAGELLTMARSQELVALSDWSLSEITRQYEGGDPTPWPGPF